MKVTASLFVFFLNAIRIAATDRRQALSFARTLLWLARSAGLRAGWMKRGVRVPPIVIFSVTNQCNLACQGCYNQSFHRRPAPELSDRELGRVIDEARALGVSFFVIAGGEPLMRQALLPIMQAHPQMVFMVFTNGTLIDEATVRILDRNRNIVPLLSLEGDEADTDRRRGEGTHRRLQQTMGEMKQRGIFFGNSLTLTRRNFDTIMSEGYIRELAASGCRFFLFLEYTPTEPGTEQWTLTREQRARMPSLLDGYRKRFSALFIGVPWDEDAVGGCLSAGRGFVHINAVGDLEPCPFAPFSDANLRDGSLLDALRSDLLRKIRAVPELARENGEGCILWKQRDLVQSLLESRIPEPR